MAIANFSSVPKGEINFKLYLTLIDAVCQIYATVATYVLPYMLAYMPDICCIYAAIYTTVGYMPAYVLPLAYMLGHILPYMLG